jgi:hypothetical protein
MNSDPQPTNPYRPPAAGPPEVPDAARIRAGLLHQEAILRVLGISYLVSAFFWAIEAGKMAMMYSVIGFEVWKSVGLFLLFAAAAFFCGRRLAFLRPGFRVLLGLATGTALLLAILEAVLKLNEGQADWRTAIETIARVAISSAGLWVLLSRGGRIMLSPEYRPIVAATPQLQVWRTPAMIAGILAILVRRIVPYI